MDLTAIEVKLVTDLIEELRKIPYGEIIVTVFNQDNRPIRYTLKERIRSKKI